MIQLLCTDQESGNQQELDLQSPGQISLNYEAADFSNPTERRSGFSQTFQVAYTDRNNRFFQHYYNLDVTDGTTTTIFDARYKVTAEIRVNGIPTIQGYLQLRSFDAKSQLYTVNVFGDQANLFQDLGTLTLADAFINDDGTNDTDLNHSLTPANVTNSFDSSNDITSGSVGAGTVIYPVIDYGTTGTYNFLFNEFSTGDFSGVSTENFLNSINFRPALKIDYLFNRIINRAGYSVNSSTFLASDDWQKLYMTMGGGSSNVTEAIDAVLACKTGVTDIQTFTFNSGDPTSLILPFDTDDGTAGVNSNPSLTFDLGNNYNTSSFEFVAPFDGIYTGQLVLSFDTSNAGGGVAGFQAFAYYGVIFSGASDVDQSVLQEQSEVYTVTKQWVAELEAGQSLQSFLQLFIQTSAATIKLKAEGSYFALTGFSSTGGTVDMRNNLPNITQAAFVRDLVQRFNLCIVADRDDPRQLTIEPYQDYFDGDTTLLDWTDKLDVSKAEIIKPTHELMKKQIQFGDLQDNDRRNRQFIEQDGQVFGTYTEDRLESFVTGTLKNAPVFSPFHVNPMPRADDTSLSDDPTFLIAQETTIEGTPPTSNKPKLMYYNGTRAVQGPPFFVDTTSVTSYPLFLPYLGTTGNLTPTSPLLYWDNVAPIGLNGLYGQGFSTQGYFSKYWAEFLQPIYNENARMYVAYIYLQETDIYNFQFSNKVAIRSTQFRVIKIEGYQPHAGTPCKVTMLKLVDKQAGSNPYLPPTQVPDSDVSCDLIVDSINIAGVVTFVDSLDREVTGTEECCLLNGYHWDGSRCIDPRAMQNSSGFSGASVIDDTSKRFSGGTKNLITKSALRVQPITGETSIAGRNNSASTSAESKHFVYQCTSIGTTATEANLLGDSTSDGTLNLPPNTMARIVVSATSVQINAYDTKASDFGSSSFRKFVFMAKNINGTLSVTSTGELTDFRTEDSAAAGRTVTVVSQAGSGGKANTNYLAIKCTGEDAKVQVAWVLDVEMTLLNFGTTKAQLGNSLYTEDLHNLTTENGNIIDNIA